MQPQAALVDDLHVLPDVRTYAFGAFKLDVVRRLLIGNGAVRALPENIFFVLLLLLEANGHIVERDTFFARIWQNEDVGDGNLTQHVSLLRSILGQKHGEDTYVLTVPRRGYRLGVPSTVVPRDVDVNAPLLAAKIGAMFEHGPVQAYQHFCRGSYYLEQRGQVALERSIELFNLSIAEDPTFSPPYLGLARAYANLGEHLFVRSDRAFPPARRAVETFLEIDRSATALAILSDILLFGSWDWTGARNAIESAIALDPHSVFVWHTMAWFALAAGDFDLALSAIGEALLVEPTSLEPTTVHARILIHRGNLNEAIALLQGVHESDPTFDFARENLAFACTLSGQPERAVSLLEESTSYHARAHLSRAYSESGNTLAAANIYADLVANSKINYVPSWPLAISAIGLRRYEEALRHLERAFEEREPSLVFLKSVPLFTPIDRDPRFRRILSRVGP